MEEKVKTPKEPKEKKQKPTSAEVEDRAILATLNYSPFATAPETLVREVQRGVPLKTVTFASQTHNPLQSGYAHLAATDNRVKSITFFEGSHIEIVFLKSKQDEVHGVSLAAVIGFVFDKSI